MEVEMTLEANTDKPEQEDPAQEDFSRWPDGPAKTMALRIYCLSLCSDEAGVMLIDHWHMAADYENYILSGEVPKRASLKSVK